MNSQDVAAKIAQFYQIYIPYSPHSDFVKRGLYLVELGQATRGLPQRGMRCLGPSGSGKTAAGMELVRQIHAMTPRTPEHVPVVFIPLERAATPKRLMVAILEYFGDPYSSHGTEQALKGRVKACFERFRTFLLIIDEIQHLNYRNSERSDVTDSLKRLLDDGVVPIIFLGTGDAHELFTRNVQLGGRLLAPCDFKPLNLRDRSDRALLASYVTLLDDAMLARGITLEASDLRDRWVQACLHAVTQGVVGRVSRLVGAALEIALLRRATRVERYDLTLAVDRWAIPNGIAKTNPFLKEEAL